MFVRDLKPHLLSLAARYPAIALVGPRQSGKTTLAQQTFPTYTYLSLEEPDIREKALLAPREFLHQYQSAEGIILDEFQRAPDLLSYMQGIIDAQYRPGFFILTGSHNFLMNKAIAQTLAGRIALITLLPFSTVELNNNNLLQSMTLEQALFKGCYPRLYAQSFESSQWFANYIETYVERDIRDIQKIVDLSLFRKFVGLCAGRIGQPLNITSLSNDCGISAITTRSWLSLLEASYIIFLLQPHHTNFGKRLIKTPKLYFYDVGLACALLRLQSPLQLPTHYLYGSLFESYVIADLYKQLYNRALRPHLYFWQDSHRHEIDCLVDMHGALLPIEIKAGKTLNPDFYKGLKYWNELSGNKANDSYLVYGGNEKHLFLGMPTLSWRHTNLILDRFTE